MNMNYPSSYSPGAQNQPQCPPQGMMSPNHMAPGPNHMGPGPGTPSGPQNPAIDSPYPNQAKSPATSLVNGPIHSPSPSQGGPPSIPPSVPEMHPSTPQGMPLSPAHTNPMTPVSVPPQAPHTPGAPMTPGDPNAVYAGTPNAGPHTPGGTASQLGQPMTPGQPTTPGNPGMPDGIDNNVLTPMSIPQQMPPCSPMTPQGQSMMSARPDQPFSPHHAPQPNGQHFLSDTDISSILPEPMKNQPPMSMGMNMPNQHFPGYPGSRPMTHPGMAGMAHPGMAMGNRMLEMNHGMMANQGMGGHHGYQQWPYPGPRPY